MKTILFLTASMISFAQSVTLTWGPSPSTGVTGYSVYRASGVCLNNNNYGKITSGVVGLTYRDFVPGGTYCYYVTATGPAALESLPSPKSEAVVPAAPLPPTTPLPPTSLTLTIQVAVTRDSDGVQLAVKTVSVPLLIAVSQ